MKKLKNYLYVSSLFPFNLSVKKKSNVIRFFIMKLKYLFSYSEGKKVNTEN